MSNVPLHSIVLFGFLAPILFGGNALAGQSLDMLVAPAREVSSSSGVPARRTERSALVTASRLIRAEVGAVDELLMMQSWNDEARLPKRNGFERPFPFARNVRFGQVERSRSTSDYLGGRLDIEDGVLHWTTRVEVEDAWRLRLRLDDVSLPVGTRMWVSSDDGETVGPFGVELQDQGGRLYTPSVAGPGLTLEVALNSSTLTGARFELRELVQLFAFEDTVGGVRGLQPKGAECLVDAQCITTSDWGPIKNVQKSAGLLMFGPGFLCSGNLLNNTNEDQTPYLLTANHCISSQSFASSLEVVWDYVTPTCESTNWPDLGSLPRSNGSTLLATGASSDYTLLRLQSLPGNRVLLGWDANGVSNNQEIYRISHPSPAGFSTPYPQIFTQYRVDTVVPICDGAPRSQFIHMKNTVSATFSGSSGSSSLNEAGQVVGQLTGSCGPDPNDGCNFNNVEVDGSFAATFPHLQTWLAPEPLGTNYPPCQPSATTLCIDRSPGDGRFQVTMTYDSVLGGGIAGDSKAVALNSVGVTKGGVFAFTNPANPEVLIKVLDACGAGGNDHFWVFFAATTTVGFELTVIDTEADVMKVYTNSDLTAAEPITDTTAFATCAS